MGTYTGLVLEIVCSACGARFLIDYPEDPVEQCPQCLERGTLEPAGFVKVGYPVLELLASMASGTFSFLTWPLVWIFKKALYVPGAVKAAGKFAWEGRGPILLIGLIFALGVLFSHYVVFSLYAQNTRVLERINEFTYKVELTQEEFPFRTTTREVTIFHKNFQFYVVEDEEIVRNDHWLKEALTLFSVREEYEKSLEQSGP